MLNKERYDDAVHPLRNLWGQLKTKRRQLAQLAEKNNPQLGAKKEQFEKWLADEFQPGVAKLQALADDFEAQIYHANQPAARKYELLRVN
jgi:hypothetical protein